ncbi:hypothetical protein K402DRAFT_339258 [Aulographum hederae CBS 113979]|uniref:Uncharacterized protein n=1 Tax=Aulographum hederae CBS 113979 TaxID=1176131 RepID=A0A6G1GQK1_9PEZI|nr:hypothetical protein K402DRAFT_339258 [Aulographum hederae CBS 113979]
MKNPQANGADTSPTSPEKRKLDQLDPPAIDSPRASPTPRSLTPNSGARLHTPHQLDITFYDDSSDPEYEYIRIPKQRDFDLLPVTKDSSPKDRDTANLPLIGTRVSDGASVTMWAKLDTGAGANVINRTTVAALLGDSARSVMRPPTFAELEFGLLGHQNLKPSFCVQLDFQAGRGRRRFEKIRFYVIEDDWEDSEGDGVPNVVLGYDFLKEHHMVMIDFEYHHDADPALEVIAPKAEDEKPGSRSLGPILYPNAPGIKRPVKK